MKADDSDAAEARFTDVLVAHHAAVAGGLTPNGAFETPRELQTEELRELERAQACLDLLERARRSAVRLGAFERSRDEGGIAGRTTPPDSPMKGGKKGPSR